MSGEHSENVDLAAPEPAPADAQNVCLTVFHDGSCPLCRREIALARRLTGGEGVAFVDVSALPSGEVAPGLSAETAMRRFHVRRADGTLASGAAAFLEMWRRSPRLSWLAGLADRPRLVGALDRIYSAFLVVRPVVSGAVRWLEARGPRR